MAIATINGELPPPGISQEADLGGLQRPDGGPASASPVAASRANGAASAASSQVRTSRAPEPFYKPMPTASAFALRADAFVPAARGYAPAAGGTETRSVPLTAAASTSAKAKASSTTKSSATKSASAKSTAKKSASKELAFLDDKHLSIEDKLFQFMVLMTKKNDDELVAAMKEYDGKKAAQSSSSSSSSTGKALSSAGEGATWAPKESVLSADGGGGLFGFLGDALGGIGRAVVGGAETLVKDLGGPALAGVATAFGMPFLAPAALQYGGAFGAGLIETVASTVGLGASGARSTKASGSSNTASKTGTSSAKATSKTSPSSVKTTAASDAEEFDEKLEMFKLQRLVEKQNAMFSALTNAMKSMHDTQMTAVQNIR